jgi:hypothetical protein
MAKRQVLNLFVTVIIIPLSLCIRSYFEISVNRNYNFNAKPEGTRKVGRPRLRWEESVWQDIRILGIRNWRNLASNREEW